ncbi:MAG TPA: glycosyltransferase family 4 protein [Aggregatilinea sp.]|uniref:glycosyltransferase family 4 protein n=1 Tax=Aggregatilinea sp. TaxID=2806333 RepID=UPI002C7236AC|nr:glycosyltransferase family 4 protein [Aggregatilinea sp.]HML25021.1 glycosyltransferase family 4 protein [Aggregatilinea sp.]
MTDIETLFQADRPLKILVTLQYYLPHRTGVPIHVQRVAEALVQRGHEVTILTARHHIDLPRDETINGVRLVRLWAPIRVSRGMVMPAYPWAAWGLIRTHDVVWMHTPMLETALVSVLAEMQGKKVISTHHGDLILPSGLFNRFVRWFTFENYRVLAKRAARLIAYSQDYADNSYYLKPFANKVSVIYPPIQVPDPDPERVAELRERWQSDGGPVIGYAGRFVEEKRPDLLIRALEVINQRFPTARVVFAGEYDIRYEDTWERNQALVTRYEEQLIFLGQLSSMQAMSNFFAACDVLVLPSDTECFALVQVEAMLCGTPVVMTDTPGGRVPVTATGMGKIVPRGDWHAIGEAVIDVLAHRDRYVKPREEIDRVFNLDETVDHYEAEFRRAAMQGRGYND